jgi:putative ABC transport system permease protein
VGILAPNGTVVDRIVLTSVETVWAVHGLEDAEGGGSHGAAEAPEASEGEEPGEAAASPPSRPMPGMPGPAQGPRPELTALLVQYSSPMAAALFPRYVNSQTSLQAASPAFETARLFNLLGIGVDALRAFGIILIVTAALGVFIALYNALKERKYDLAIMRTLGASRSRLVWHVLLEGVLLAGMGLVAGLLLGHAAAEVLGGQFAQTRQMAMTGWTWAAGEWGLVLLAVGVGLVAALLPAYQAYRTDIARTLSAG